MSHLTGKGVRSAKGTSWRRETPKLSVSELSRELSVHPKWVLLDSKPGCLSLRPLAAKSGLNAHLRGRLPSEIKFSNSNGQLVGGREFVKKLAAAMKRKSISVEDIRT